MNLNGFYRAVVEENNDPDKRGRVRVRIWGLHTEKKIKSDTEGIPTNELPWAEPCLPIHEGGVSGFGMFGVPLQGSHVMIFFESGNISQPRYFASLPSFPTIKSDKTTGFNDPQGKYPLEKRLNEPDYHRLARGVTDKTLVEKKNSDKAQGVATASGETWNEPSLYGTVYPHNFVIVTHAGVVIEMDSTPDHNRLHLYHPSNSYIEIGHDGDMIIRNQSNRYNIVLGSSNSHVKGNENITADENVNIFAGTDVNIKATGNVNIEGGTVNIN
jgi:hypothetical protein